VFDWINNDNGGGGKGDKVAVIRSTDDGHSWSQHAIVVAPMVDATVVDPTTGDPVRTGDAIPEPAYDPRTGSNTVYVVWQAASASSRASIYFAKSTDGGQTWSTPKIVNTVVSTEAFTPAIRVDRNGTIAINYYDFRNDTASEPLTTDYWSIVSRDGGNTWDESHISGPFDQRTAAIARGYFLGDYAGLSAADTSALFHSAFAQSTGAPPAHASDIEESDALDG
jgi:Neuraminidase (sialidase)